MAVIRLRLNQMDPDLEAAAWNLGGSEWQAMRHVIVPFCKPAIVSALFLTAAVSFDEFAVSWFVSGLNRTAAGGRFSRSFRAISTRRSMPSAPSCS